MILSKARAIAQEILITLMKHTTLLHVAGSIRRKKSLVSDIEIVCLPELSVPLSLFADSGKQERSPGFIDAIKSLGEIRKGDPYTGRYLQIILSPSPDREQLDLFIPQPHDYWRQYAIRTGSADYARDHIAAAWRKIGWVGTPDGLRLESECYASAHTVFGVTAPKQQWHCTEKNPTLPPIWTSEEDFFDWLGEKWINPEERI